MEIGEIISLLNKSFNQRNRDGMARFGIPSDNAVGLSNPNIRNIAKSIWKNHELALNLWKVDIYEAKILAGLIDDPKFLTTGQMHLWAKDFNSWALCDSTWFSLCRSTSFALN